MNKKIILTKGLSGSGKTTWANEFVKDNPDFVIVCKDDIRAEFPNGIKEGKVIAKRNQLIEDVLVAGKSVIVADTNLAKYHAHDIYNRFHREADIEINDSFLSVPVEECIRRTASRPKPDGTTWEEIIRRQKEKYGVVYHATQDESLPKAIISDFDGTIAHMSPFRSPYDGTFQHLDTPNKVVMDYLKSMSKSGYQIIVVSGLEDVYYYERNAWLEENGIFDHLLYMRKSRDHRKDSEIKDDIFEEFIRGKYYIHAILDDRPQMLRYWIDKGYSRQLLSIGNPFHEF